MHCTLGSWNCFSFSRALIGPAWSHWAQWSLNWRFPDQRLIMKTELARFRLACEISRRKENVFEILLTTIKITLSFMVTKGLCNVFIYMFAEDTSKFSGFLKTLILSCYPIGSLISFPFRIQTLQSIETFFACFLLKLSLNLTNVFRNIEKL